MTSKRDQVTRSLDFTGLGEVSIAVLSDTHGQIAHHVCGVVERCDIALHAGDIFHGDILRKMRPRRGEVIAVKGNNDVRSKWNAEDFDLLATLPDVVHLELLGGRLSMEHGHRIWDTANYHRRLRAKHPESRTVVYGHTHKQCVDQDGEPWVLNPGAAGRVRTHGGPSCLEIDVSASGWRVRGHKFALEPLAGTG